MALPATIAVSLDVSSSPTFGVSFTIGDAKYGVLGTGTLGNTATSDVYDLSDVTRSVKIQRGRNVQRDTYEAGQATIVVTDANSYFNPQNTSSPYYGKLAPLRKIRVSATTATSQSFLFSGYVTDYFYTYPTSQDIGFVTLQCVDAFRLFQLAQVQTVTGTSAGQTTSARLGNILDQVSWPSNMRQFDTGNSLCINDPGTLRTVLDAAKNVEYSEQGAFYLNAAGTAVFKNRNSVVQAAAATPLEFNQTGGIPYAQLAFAFDDKLIVNTATMTRYGGTAQTAQNATSVAKYFVHNYNQTNLVIDTDANALNIAATVVATRQETTIRIDAMTLDLQNPSVPTDTILAIDYFRNMTISNIQPDGSVITKTLQCQGLAWDITPNTMKVTLTTLENIVDGFLIGSATNGILGSSAMTY